MRLKDEVESSQIDSMQYDQESGIARVLFKGATAPIWDYPGINPDEYRRALHPGPEFRGSVGKAFNAIIKGPHGQKARKVSEIDLATGLRREF